MSVSELQPRVNAIKGLPLAAGNQGICDEHSLVAKAKSGRDDAFAELYKRHKRKAYCTALRILRNQQDAEDAVQNAFQRALVNLQRFREDSAFSTWLTRIVINEALMVLRQRRTQELLHENNVETAQGDVAVEVADGRPTQEEVLCESELRAALFRAIGELRKNLRIVVFHREVQGLTSAETARRLGLSVSAVKGRTFHARRFLRKHLERSFKRAGALIHSVSHAVLEPSGDLVGIVGATMDIAERKRAEEQLQQFVDLVPQMGGVVGPDGKWIYTNRVHREYTGLTVEESRSLDATGRITHPGDAENVRAACECGLAGSEPFEFDARLLGKDGVHRWFHVRYSPLVEEGRVRRWYVSAREMETRKQEEERIRQENVRLEERTRIARELHDTLLQTVFGTSLQLGAIVNKLPADSQVKSKLNSILQLMERGLEEGRNAIQGLRSADSHPLDLVVALAAFRQEFSAQPGVDFRVSVFGQQHPFSPTIQQEVYRVCREALVNAFRHSQAKRIDLELEYGVSNLTMRVRDDGRGIDSEVLDAGREGHWGIAGMRERAARIGGVLKISSSANGGTEIELSIPSDIASNTQQAIKRGSQEAN